MVYDTRLRTAMELVTLGELRCHDVIWTTYREAHLIIHKACVLMTYRHMYVADMKVWSCCHRYGDGSETRVHQIVSLGPWPVLTSILGRWGCAHSAEDRIGSMSL